MDNQQVNFISNLYRDRVLPDILGTDLDTILYWAGKNLADEYQLDNTFDLPEFFSMANLGTLQLEKEKNLTYTFSLSGQTISDRIEAHSLEFSLETGIIAATIANEQKSETEATYEVNQKKHLVEIVARTSK